MGVTVIAKSAIPKKIPIESRCMGFPRTNTGTASWTGLRPGSLDPTSQLVLNYFEARFTDDIIEGFSGPYDKARLDLLRRTRTELAFLRDRNYGSVVYAWRKQGAGGQPPSGFEPVSMSRGSYPGVFARAMLDAIDAKLQKEGFARLPSAPYVFRFVNFGSGNLLDEIAELRDARLGIYPVVTIQSFVTTFGDGVPHIGIVIDVDHFVKLDVRADELHRMGMDLRGLYVRLRLPEGVSSPFVELDGRAVARVASVDGDKAVLDDPRRPDLTELPLSYCLVTPDRRNFNTYLQHRLGERYRRVQQEINEKFARQIAPKRRLQLIEGFVRKLLAVRREDAIQTAAGLGLWFEANHPLSPERDEFKVNHLPEPLFSFDIASERFTNRADEGLEAHGPFDREQMSARKLRVVFLTPESHKGQVEKFVERFRSGIDINDSRYQGFLNKYRLENVELEIRPFSVKSAKVINDYTEACRELARHQATNPVDLCFVVTREQMKSLPPRENPYYVGKNLLLGFDIAVQDVLVETLLKPDNVLQFVLNNIALAAYAKLGGRPFLLRTPNAGHLELVFGIGSSVQKDSRWGAGRRVVGITTLFTRDGDYVLNGCTPYTDFETYERRLNEVVSQAVREAVELQALPNGSKVRLIFHVFKQTGKAESQAIRSAVAGFPGYDVEYAIAHVNTDHGFKLFDRTNPGRRFDYTKRGYTEDDLAAFVSDRGWMVNLGPRDRLLNLIGPRQFKRRGCPRPTRVTLDRSSTFKDIDYVTEQIYHFAYMSWRGFQPSRDPITIFYSSLIADLNSKLNELGGWNPERVNINLRRKMWFL